MRYLFLFIFLLTSQSSYSSMKDALIRKYEYYRKHNDSLGQRIAIKKLASEKISYKEWHKIRSILMRNPRLGFDIVYKWDQLGRNLFPLYEKDQLVNHAIEQADNLMLGEKYEDAFKKYQAVAKIIRPTLKNDKDNLLVYQKVLHSMARALYSMGQFKTALEVYGWLDQDYPRIKQVLFEKMWAGFRAGRLDIANGMIASQLTSYFSNYLEPEVYLVQIYIYKSLCREDEIKAVRKRIEDLRAEFKKDDTSRLKDEWAQSDIELYSIYRLAYDKNEKKPDESESFYQEKKKEQEKLRTLFDRRFATEKVRVQAQLDKVLAYSYLAIGSTAFKKDRTDIKSRDHLLKYGEEFWPVDDNEDWVDEIGDHLYIGDSQCHQK